MVHDFKHYARIHLLFLFHPILNKEPVYVSQINVRFINVVNSDLLF